MKKRQKKLVSLGLALCMGALCLGTGEAGQVTAAESTDFDMSASSPTGDEDWSKLRIDMGSPETNATGSRGTPLGNGLFAAKENGGVQEDIFPLNHSTFWSGDPEYRDTLFEGNGGYGNTQEERNAAYKELVETLKSAYSEGISQAERDALMESVAATTQGLWESNTQSSFLSVGQMKLSFPELTGTEDYQRILDLDTATSEISFTKDGTAYMRETFISNPDNVMVTHITNEESLPMDMGVELVLPSQMTGKSDDNKVTVDKENSEVVMTGRAPYDFSATQWDEERGTLLEARAKVILPEGGEISYGETSIIVTDAPEILVMYTCETSFKDAFTDPSNSGVDYSGKVRTTLDNASEKTYEELKERHLEEYRSLFRRFWLDMEGENIVTGNGTEVSPYEYARHYQYGRYINIACERANSVIEPGVLGLWSPSWVGANQGAFFMNENMEKMQLIKGAGNLEDSSDAQYNVIKSWTSEETGGKAAEVTYGAEDGAWMMSHSTGIWARTGMWGETVEYSSWLSAGIWALDSLYDKYDYTQDISLLEKYYPIMEGAAKFALSNLIEVDGVNGELKGYKVVAPAGSPEHWYWVGDTKVGFDIASTCDTLLYYNLFNMMESGAKELERAGISYDTELLERVREAKNQMIPLEMLIDEDTGRLKEWYNEYPVGDTRHRHASHLLGLFLGHLDINEADTPEFYYAQQAEMERWMNANGGTHPDRSVMAVRAGFEDFAFANMTCGIIGTGYGHSDVLTWGPIAGSIGEAILDSRFDEINIMENLPSAWSSGTVKGIRARGGYQLSITWEDGELVSCVIDSPTGETPRVLYKGEPVVLSEDSRFTVNRAQTTLQELQYEVQDKLGDKYTEESKQALEQALATNDYNTISDALMDMEPINYVTTEVTVSSENGVNVLTENGQTLQLTASGEKENAEYRWAIEAADGGSAEKIASVDENGKVTAIGGGKVKVTASLKNEPRSMASIDILVETDSYMLKECVDDRDDRIQYEGTSWATWDESKHANGTITYSMNEPGAKATLEFEGSGIEFIGSSALHIGDFKVIIDGETVADRIVSSEGERGYAVSMYTNMDLEEGTHSITIEAIDRRIDIDAFNVYEKVSPTTDRTALVSQYLNALNITDAEHYTTETWNAFQEAAANALSVINNFDAAQTDIDQAQTALADAQNALVKIFDDKTLLQKTYEYALKLSTEGVTDSAREFFENALAEAKAVLDNPDVSQEEVNSAWDKLLEGIWGLGLVQGDKDNLGLLIEKAESMVANADKYVPDNWQILVDALAEAKDVWNDGDAMEEDVTPAAEALLQAILSQRYQADKSILNDLINRAESLDLSVYTKESVQVLNAALKTAKAVMEDSSLSVDDQNKVDETAETLRTAIEGLTKTSESGGEGGQGSQPGSDAGQSGNGSAGGTSGNNNGSDDGSASNSGNRENSPKTGDESTPVLWAVLVIAAAAGIVAAVRMLSGKRKMNR